MHGHVNVKLQHIVLIRIYMVNITNWSLVDFTAFFHVSPVRFSINTVYIISLQRSADAVRAHL